LIASISPTFHLDLEDIQGFGGWFWQIVIVFLRSEGETGEILGRSRALGNSLRILKGDLRADHPLQFPTLFSRIVSFFLRIYQEGLRAPLSFLVSGFSGASGGEVF
jgi:hypothetical protein